MSNQTPKSATTPNVGDVGGVRTDKTNVGDVGGKRRCICLIKCQRMPLRKLVQKT
ncbi:hypothetical protein [Helicobacter magdeburgensis]|uniref:hypothetical protein n=1 Tax=Helicobacter magdeburgensis TaxID=471858 RepID=UPI000A4489C4|nr:hypothetical protein [Helicobacter magdeburgensis]